MHLINASLLNAIALRPQPYDMTESIPPFLRPAVGMALVALIGEGSIYQTESGWSPTLTGRELSADPAFRYWLASQHRPVAETLIRRLEKRVSAPGGPPAMVSSDTSSGGVINVYRIWESDDDRPWYSFQFLGSKEVNDTERFEVGWTEDERRAAATTHLSMYLIS